MIQSSFRGLWLLDREFIPWRTGGYAGGLADEKLKLTRLGHCPVLTVGNINSAATVFYIMSKTIQQ
jgi:hypothetical protein